MRLDSKTQNIGLVVSNPGCEGFLPSYCPGRSHTGPARHPQHEQMYGMGNCARCPRPPMPLPARGEIPSAATRPATANAISLIQLYQKLVNQVSAHILPSGGIWFQSEPRKYQAMYVLKWDAQHEAVDIITRILPHHIGDISGVVTPMGKPTKMYLEQTPMHSILEGQDNLPVLPTCCLPHPDLGAQNTCGAPLPGVNIAEQKDGQ